MLLSPAGVAATATSLEFFFIWELITLSSYFLIVRRREAAVQRCATCCSRWLAAFFLLAGFALMHAANGSISLAALRASGAATAARRLCSWPSAS